MPFPRRSHLITVLIVSLIVAVAWRACSGHRDSSILAQVDSQAFTLKDIEPTTLRRLEFMEFDRHALLRSTVHEWIENQLLQKEATARSISVKELLKKEVLSRSSVSAADVYRVYAASPKATALPYEAALAQIRAHLTEQAKTRNRKALMDQLSKKYEVTNLLETPKGFVHYITSKQDNFPAFAPPAARSQIKDGLVVAPPFKGGAEAGAVLIEVFSDFMCPFSAKFSKSLDAVLPAYGDKVRIEYRHLPLSFHKGADKLAQASACAQEQGKFWQFHDAQYAAPGGYDEARVRGIAGKIGADADRLIACVNKETYRPLVEADMAEAASRGARGTPAYFVNKRFISGATPPDMIKKIIDWTLSPTGKFPYEAPKPKQPAQPAKGAPAQPAIRTFTAEEISSSPSRGPVDAPVTIIEFVDFQCPFCKRGAGSLKTAMDARKNDVRLISKQFPLEFHKEAPGISKAALCAGEQGKYWEYRDEMLGNSFGKKTDDELKAVAKTMGVDLVKFDACRSSQRIADVIEKDSKLGAEKGVRGTPSFFINGQLTAGALETQKFIDLIDKEKAKAAKK